MTRFIVCSKVENGIVRVLDTSDWTVEGISVEQLKLIQSMGYPLVFDERYDFIYKIYSDSSFPGNSFNEMEELCGFRVPYDDIRYNRGYALYKEGVEVYCFASVNDVIMVTVRKVGSIYKLTYNDDIRSKLPVELTQFAGRVVEVNDKSTFKLNYIVGGWKFSAIFDFACNYIGEA